MVAQTESTAQRKHFFTTSPAILDQELEVSAMVTSITVRATSPTAFFQIRSISALLLDFFRALVWGWHQLLFYIMRLLKRNS